MSKRKIVPVLLGADMNCYGVARAFHMAYGVMSFAFARYPLGATKHSHIVKVTVVPDLYDESVFLKTLAEFADAHPDEALILVGCTDTYAELIIKHRDELSKAYFCPCPERSLAEKLISKASFYEMCRAYDISYPRTVVIGRDFAPHLLDNLPFSYPIILKPSSSIRYWLHPFEGMQKVYLINTPSEARATAERIFGAGYDDSLILQEYIGGDDSDMFVLTAYCDRRSRARLLCLGHVLLEEHTPRGRGNHTAILTEYRPRIMEQLRAFLEDIGYHGFANFDMKLDPESGELKVFEINLRQGRSNFYVTNSGFNLAEYLVEDSENTLGERVDIVRRASFWYTVPRHIIYSYIKSPKTERTARRLVRIGRAGTTFGYPYDLARSPWRLLYTAIHHARYFGKYRRYP